MVSPTTRSEELQYQVYPAYGECGRGWEEDTWVTDSRSWPVERLAAPFPVYTSPIWPNLQLVSPPPHAEPCLSQPKRRPVPKPSLPNAVRPAYLSNLPKRRRHRIRDYGPSLGRSAGRYSIRHEHPTSHFRTVPQQYLRLRHLRSPEQDFSGSASLPLDSGRKYFGQGIKRKRSVA